MPLAPPVVIPAPRRDPWPNGLVDYAREESRFFEHRATVAGVGTEGESATDDERFAAGIQFAPLVCTDPERFGLCSGTTKTTGLNRPDGRGFLPSAIIGRDSCATFGWKQADYEQRARDLLADLLSTGIEAELWTGATEPTNPNFSDGSATILGGGTVGLSTALALLVQAIADGNGGVGVIHARPKLVSLWCCLGCLCGGDDGMLRTCTGIPVVAGSGYPGTGPNGEAITATDEWAFATDGVDVHVGPPVLIPDNLTQATDRESNTVEYRAEQVAAALFNGCVLSAVDVDLTATI